MSSITTWTRLEPRPRTSDLERSLAARVHDPAWLLARQWQLGEFQGEDGGTPVEAMIAASVGLLETLTIGGATQRFDPTTQVLEAEAEKEPPPALDAGGYRRAAIRGRQFLGRLDAGLRARYQSALLEAFPLPALAVDRLHPTDVAWVRLAGGRVPDGYAMEAAWIGWLERGSAAPAFVDSNDRDAFQEAAKRWLAQGQGLWREAAPGAGAWSGPELRYRFSVSAPDPAAAVVAPASSPALRLGAPDHRGGRLDWYSFDAERIGVSLAAGGWSSVVRTVWPAPLTFRGMPAARWWEFEDQTVSLGRTEVAPEDLSRLLLLEYVLCHANDHFVIPLSLPPGSVCAVRQLVVRNTFGEATAVGPVGAAGTRSATAKPWRMFLLSEGADGHYPGLFLAPALPGGLSWRITEEIQFARDETANVVWAVERRVSGPSGSSHPPQERPGASPPSRSSSSTSSASPGSASGLAVPSGEVEWEYRLAEPVPAHWHPYVPVQLPPAGRTRSRGIRLQRVEGEPAPVGQWLREPAHEFLNEEEVPRSGVTARRIVLQARWAGGQTVVWGSREVESGAGEASSGLRFDSLVTGPPASG